MRRRTSRLRSMVTLGTGAVLALGLVSAPAVGTTPRPVASGPSRSVTILLKAPRQAALNRLATATGRSHVQRVAALEAVLPTAAEHRVAADGLRAAGFTITGETPWTITATAPASAVAASFGVAPSVPASAGRIARIRAASSLPTVPASIAAVTAAALPTSGGPALFTPLACTNCRTGTDFRNAYTAPKVAPATGVDARGPLTIATLQFAGWNRGDLTKYAATIGLPNPVSSKQFVQIPVGEKGVPGATKQENGADEEVDLDQEAILSTSPTAKERAYFNPNNTAGGYIADLNQVLADVTESGHAYQGGDPKIVALSTSWGACEDEFSLAFNSTTIRAMENVLKSLTAAGVTIFAASGDDGIYDCGDAPTSSRVAVDYPASSPEVVSVGGTRLTRSGASAPNTGANWTDQAWSCTSPTMCQGTAKGDTGGSGGGESKLFLRPSYQAAGIGRDPFTTSTGKTGSFGRQPRRLVPDISDDGDPKSGFEVLTSDPVDLPHCPKPHAAGSCQFPIGGTSLSSPEAAALFTNMLASRGLTAGVGDIHNALYSAYAAKVGAFRDVTTGTNGRQQSVDAAVVKSHGAELPVRAQPGYDTVTGLGTPLWPRLAPFIFTPTAPTASTGLALTNRFSAKQTTLMTARWTGRLGGASGSAPSTAAVTITKVGTTRPVFRNGVAPPSGSHRFLAAPGSTYQITVVVKNLVGQTSERVQASSGAPYDDELFNYRGAWRRIAGSRDIGGSRVVTHTQGSSASIGGVGSSYSVRVRTGPGYGKLAVYQGSRRVRTLDLYSAKPAFRFLTVASYPVGEVRRRTFTFRYTGEKDRRATGTTVGLDAFYVGR